VVSGHDLPDLAALCELAEEHNINVYTHGELLPAHGYPQLRKYKSLVGNYGSAWQNQKTEFDDFPGAIVMTSNCLMPPMKTYKDRVFSRYVVGHEDVTHLKDRSDFQKIIDCALASPGFTEEDIAAMPKVEPQTVGFGWQFILDNAATVVKAVNDGKIKHFFVIGGCDGAEGERNYFTEVGKALPQDTAVLTLGCGKFRINNIGLGALGDTGLPRLFDLGQCNDAYGGVRVALALSEAFGVPVNKLPLSFALSWLEQKAVAVFLMLLSFNVENIRVGPALPAFLTPNLIDVLVKNFKVHPIGDPKEDVALMMKNM